MVMVQLKDMSQEIGYFIFIFLTKIGRWFCFHLLLTMILLFI